MDVTPTTRKRRTKEENEAFRMRTMPFPLQKRPRTLYFKFNPAPQIQCYTLPADEDLGLPRKALVFRDDKLHGGTKIRGLVEWFDSFEKGTTLIFACTSRSYAQVAFVIACAHLKIKAKLFISDVGVKSTNTNLAIRYNRGNCVSFEMVTRLDRRNRIVPGGLPCSIEASKLYYEEHKESSILIELGFNNSNFKDILKKNLRSSYKDFLGDAESHMFLVVGSGTLFSCFARAFPLMKFSIVIIGNLFDIRKISHSIYVRTTVVGTQTYYSNPIIIPPYPSSKLMDGKLWRFVLDHLKDGDFVLNIARS